MRIGGLASGMDTDSIVKDLMKVERMPLVKLKQDKQILEWKREDYRSINTLLLDFRSELTQMSLTSRYRARTTSSSDESMVTATATSAASQSSYNISNVSQLATAAILQNEGSISADSSAKVDVTKGLYNQKAKFLNSQDPSTTWKQGAIENKTITATTDDQVIQLGQTVKDTDAMSIKVDGKSFKVVTGKTQAELLDNEVLVNSTSGDLTFKQGIIKQDSVVKAQYITQEKTESLVVGEKPIKTWQVSGGSLNNFALSIDGTEYGVGNSTGKENEFELSSNGNVIGTINKETGLISFNTEMPEGVVLEATYNQNYTSFSLGAYTSKGETYENFIFSGNTSLNNVINKVNSSNVGLTMFYDSFSDQMTLTRKETGNFHGLDSKDPDYGVSPEDNQEIMTSGAFVNNLLRFGNGNENGGDNIKFKINNLETERTSNTFEVSGVTFNVKKTFDSGTATIGVSNDSNQVFENIKSFVEKYNELIEKVNKKTTEDRYRSYDPLTDEQRESLSDKQQEQWEEKARSGLLKGDPVLTSILSSMRMDFYTPVSNDSVSTTYNQLASIGITTTSNYLEGGKLTIDEAKLKKAIESDPQSVENLFRGDGSTFSEKGIIDRLTESVNKTMEKLNEKAGKTFYTNEQFTIGRQIDGMDDQIERFEDRLVQIENRYWRQFTAMEKAIQRANSQSMYLMQQFGGM